VAVGADLAHRRTEGALLAAREVQVVLGLLCDRAGAGSWPEESAAQQGLGLAVLGAVQGEHAGLDVAGRAGGQLASASLGGGEVPGVDGG
jgi:hypothetical protein